VSKVYREQLTTSLSRPLERKQTPAVSIFLGESVRGIQEDAYDLAIAGGEGSLHAFKLLDVIGPTGRLGLGD
jgi:hypothetical protein